MSDIESKRSLLIPVLQGVIWMASIGFSVFFDFGEGFPSHTSVIKLLIFIILTIFFELLLVSIDIKFALQGYIIERDLSWRLQMRTIPWLIIVVSALMPAFMYAGYLAIICLIVSWGLLKIGLLHSVSVIDNRKTEDFNIKFE